MIGWIVALLMPTAGWLAGHWLARTRPGRASLTQHAVAGALLPAGLQAWQERTFLEQLAGWGLAFFGWAAGVVGGDPEFLAATWLGGAAWGLVLGGATIGRQQWHEASRTIPVASGQPPTQAPSRPRPALGAEGEEDLAFRLNLRCPTCGAEVSTTVYHHMTRCEFCASEHVVLGQDTTIRAVIPDAVTDRAALKSSIVKHLRRLHFQKLYERRVRPLQQQVRVDGDGREISFLSDVATPPMVAAMERQVEREADAYAGRIESRLSITDWQRFLAPYWHRFGTLYQVAFGRDDAGSKRMEFVVATLESSAPASSAPLPEMGKLSYLRALRPLAGSPESALPALPVARGHEELDRTALEPTRRRTDLSIMPIAARGTFVPETLALIYRPWHQAVAELDGTRLHFLVDGGGADVAEVGAIDIGGEEAIDGVDAGALRLTPSRCPECGADLPFARDTVVHLCRNCFRALEIAGDRWRQVSYLREEPRDGFWLAPFWCFPVRLRATTGELSTELAHLTDGIDGTFDQIGDRPQGTEHFFVPGFRARVSKVGVRFYRRIWPLLRQRRTLHRERFSPAAQPDQMVATTLPAVEAREFARVYLALAFSARDLARADIHRVRAAFLDAELEGEPFLAFLNLPSEVVEPYRNLFGRMQPQAVRTLSGT